MQIVVFYCLGNNDKGKALQMCDTDAIFFFCSIFNGKLVESTDMEPMDMGWGRGNSACA